MRGNQLRLWLASLSYVLVNALRRVGLKGTALAHAQVGTIRTRLLKLGGLNLDPPRRPQRADLPRYALLHTSPQGVCDLSSWRRLKQPRLSFCGRPEYTCGDELVFGQDCEHSRHPEQCRLVRNDGTMAEACSTTQLIDVLEVESEAFELPALAKGRAISKIEKDIEGDSKSGIGLQLPKVIGDLPPGYAAGHPRSNKPPSPIDLVADRHLAIRPYAASERQASRLPPKSDRAPDRAWRLLDRRGDHHTSRGSR